MGVDGKPLAPGAEQGEALDLVTQEGFRIAALSSPTSKNSPAGRGPDRCGP